MASIAASVRQRRVASASPSRKRTANRFFVVDWLSGNVILPKEYLLVSCNIVAKAAIIKSLLRNSHTIQAVEIIPMPGETIATAE